MKQNSYRERPSATLSYTQAQDERAGSIGLSFGRKHSYHRKLVVVESYMLIQAGFGTGSRSFHGEDIDYDS